MREMKFDHTVEELLKDIHPGTFEIFKHILPKDLDPAIFARLLKLRLNQKYLKSEEKQLFNDAIKAAIADGLYGPIAAIHADMVI